jgi:hypothetical protein
VKKSSAWAIVDQTEFGKFLRGTPIFCVALNNLVIESNRFLEEHLETLASITICSEYKEEQKNLHHLQFGIFQQNYFHRNFLKKRTVLPRKNDLRTVDFFCCLSSSTIFIIISSIT